MATHNGYDVAEIQQLLNSAGYQPPLTVDGIYGSQTTAAVRWYQQQHGLKVDGDVGPQTWGAMHGQTSGGGSTAAAQPAASPDASQSDIASMYPEFAYLVNDPEVGGILRAAYANKTPPNTLAAQLKATSWWRNNTDAARQYFYLANTDPAQFQQTIQDIADQITALAKRSGIDVGPEEIYGLAKNALWTGHTSQSALAALLFNSPHTTFSGSSALLNEVKQLAGDYGIKVDDGTAQTWARQLGMGQLDQNALKANIITMAKGKYPLYTKQLDEGLTVRQLFSPFQQEAANELGVSAESIDVNDPKWAVAMQARNQDGSPMTLYQWQVYYRTHPEYGYDNSQSAREQSANFATTLLKEFGALG